MKSCAVAACGFLWLLLLAMIAATGLTHASDAADPSNSHKLLILYSYHPGHPWTDKVSRGIRDALDKAGIRIEVFTEYMDVRRADAPGHRENLHRCYKTKYDKIALDVVLACDDEALELLVSHRQEFLTNVPLVYSGLHAPASPVPGIVGIIQDSDYMATVNVALKLRPGARRIVVVLDGTATSLAHEAAVQKLAQSVPPHVTIEILSMAKLQMDEVCQQLAGLKDDSVVLVLGHNRDKTGREFTFAEAMGLIRAACPVPMFSVTDSRLGLGIVGGKLVSGYSQGSAAAEKVVRILRNGLFDAGESFTRAENRFMFDYNELNRFNIALSALPEGSEIINQPGDTYHVHPAQILGVFATIIALCAVIVLLGWMNFMRQRAELALRAKSNELDRFFDTSMDLLCIADTDGRFLRINRQWEKTLGYQIDEIMAHRFFDFIHPDDQEGTRKVIAELSEQKPVMDFVNRYKHKDGSYRLIEWRSIPVGRIVYAAARDVTDRRQMEERLQQSEKLNAIGQLAGGVAHDFNNQLGVMMGYADMLARGLEPGDFKNYARDILSAAQRGADLTKQLLDFARKGSVMTIPVDMRQIIAEVVNMVTRSFDKRIRIKQYLGAEQSVVLGDPSQLQNALLNLALNARDAMPQGGELMIETSDATLDDEYCRNCTLDIVPGQYVCVNVTDTGCGMSSEVRKHLFEPFFTTKKPGKGTGLGLAGVYATVKNHHGAIAVESEVNQGSKFKLYLPVTDEVPEPSAPVKTTAPVRGAARILFVDDEDLLRTMAAVMLRSLGYDVVTQPNGREAVEYYRNNWRDIDLVILDMIMPEMGGHEAFLAMREVNPKVKALLSSGYSMDGEAQSILDDGVTGFVGKPYRQTGLSMKVAEALAWRTPQEGR